MTDSQQSEDRPLYGYDGFKPSLIASGKQRLILDDQGRCICYYAADGTRRVRIPGENEGNQSTGAKWEDRA